MKPAVKEEEIKLFDSSVSSPVLQFSLFDEESTPSDKYADYVKSPRLKIALTELEDKFLYKDESHFFANLVNPSKSKSQPYYRWARYREGYSGDLVTELIHRSGINTAQQYVIDPMCGSGTTVFESSRSGFNCLGLDVNPFATDLSAIKLQTYSEKDINQIKEFVDSDFLTDKQIKINITDGQQQSERYFNKQNYTDLLRIKSHIESIENGKAKNLLFLAWLTILEPCSNRRKEGNGLATVETKVTDVETFYIEKVKLMLSDISNCSVPDIEISICNDTVINTGKYADAFGQKINKSAGAIIFSPPYANSFDYFESYKLELLFGGYCDFEGLQQLREKAIRSYRICYGYQIESDNSLVELICQEIMNAVPEKEKLTGKRDSRTRIVPNLLRGYFADMEKAIEVFSNILPTNGKCYIVVDQSSYVGVIVPTDLIFADTAEKYGFEVESIIKCRKANTSAQQLTRFPYLKTLLRESIVCLKKK
jgi:site-specific DNA-methyltransferase (adenine-specific)